MKKLFAFLIVLILIFSLAACKQYSVPLEDIVRMEYQESGTQSTPITLTQEEQQEIVSVLNSGNWNRDAMNFMDDYQFTVNGVRMGYHDGYIRAYDLGYPQLLVLSEEDTQRVNQILGFEG